MVNILDFTNRIKELLTYYDLTASLFADKIGVQRSSISHIISGRNKPSLDFILKVTTTFKEVDIKWLLNGVGHFPSQEVSKVPPTPTHFAENEGYAQNSGSKKIQRIVVFFDDGTFSEYQK